MKDIKKIILGNKFNAEIFSLGEEVFIVGGCLRDILSGRESKDIDYIVRGDIKAFAQQFLAHKSGSAEMQKLLSKATLVELKKELMIRIVLKNGSTLDFTELKSGLEDNLRERDFTMNALAWSPETGMIDPVDGLKDIKMQRISAVSIDNFRDDPLRLLRVYRFISELGWEAGQKTRSMVKALKREIKKSAAERITVEIIRILNSDNYINALKKAFDDGLLENFLSVSGKNLSANIKALPVLESRMAKIPSVYKAALNEPLSQGLTLRGLLRLEQILIGSMFSENRLSLSKLISERLRIVHRLLSESEKHDLAGKGNLFDTLAKAKDAAFDFLILSGNVRLLERMRIFNKVLRGSFFTSEEVMKITGLKSGVSLGNLIYRLKKMEFEGRLKTKKEALKWLKLNYS